MSAPNPEVSVIIPTYNRKHFIDKAIESVLNQTYQNYELIVVDDGSSDGTAELIAANYPSVKLVRWEVNRGATVVLNEGIRLATGEFIAFLDSDDQWKPGYLEAQIKALKENPKAVTSYCNYIELKTKDGSEAYMDIKPWPIYPNLTHQLLMDNVIQSMSLVVVRRQALLQAGCLNETLKISYDRELQLRMLYQGEIIHVPEYLVIKVSHGGNIVGNYRLWAKEVLMLLDIFFADERSQPYKHLEAKARSHWSLKLAKIVWLSHHDLIFVLQMIARGFWFDSSLVRQRVSRIIPKIISSK